MATVTRQPTSNTTPDPAQGGTAVTGAGNTGHASTNVTHTNAPGSTIKSCLWTGFGAVGGQIQSVTLSFGYQQDGTVSGDTGTNNFRVQYSLNGGSSWTDAHNVTDVTSSSSATVQVALSVTQDLTQVQLRDRLQCAGDGVGSGATLDITISDIQIQATITDGNLIVMM